MTLAEAKEQLGILDAIHDTKLLRFIDAATASVETYLGSRLMPQTVRLDMNGFGINSDIDLGVYPVSAVTAVAYDDEDDAEQTAVLDTDYWQSLSGLYPYIRQIDGWPVTYANKVDSVRITMTAGYSDITDIPKDIRHAILLRVAEMFNHNSESIVGQTLTPTSVSVRLLTDMHRRITS